ncbi:MAG: hypothetical protein HY544_01155 [Candidatus Diapherotrites archaeon]|uniref:Uncharacterized protein n=1 Tax=Candidatus Iainarchaeum sp. TaxID=3101447 RepID=A0A8T3YK94_9ARCH|nr:hypothetical protein [Candidatus Diapherotrites archaeon]
MPLPEHRGLTSFRRLFRLHGVPLTVLSAKRVNDVKTMNRLVTDFVDGLQARYPFTFMKGDRGASIERQWMQEKTSTHFMLALLADSLEVKPEIRSKALRLAGLMSEKIKRPTEELGVLDFGEPEIGLAKEIGEDTFKLMGVKAEELSREMKPNELVVNQARHTIYRSFGFVGKLLMLAKYASKR